MKGRQWGWEWWKRDRNKNHRIRFHLSADNGFQSKSVPEYVWVICWWRKIYYDICKILDSGFNILLKFLKIFDILLVKLIRKSFFLASIWSQITKIRSDTPNSAFSSAYFHYLALRSNPNHFKGCVRVREVQVGTRKKNGLADFQLINCNNWNSMTYNEACLPRKSVVFFFGHVNGVFTLISPHIGILKNCMFPHFGVDFFFIYSVWKVGSTHISETA